MPVTFDRDRNLNIFVLLVLTVIGVFWLSSKISGSSAPGLYFNLFTMVLVLIVVAILFFIKENDYLKKYNVEIPIANTTSRSTAMLIAGFLIMVIFLSITALPLFKSSSVTNAKNVIGLSFAPLSSFKTNPEAATFSALSTVSDPFFKPFIIGNTASAIEEFSIGFEFVVIGAILTFWILLMLKSVVKIKNKSIGSTMFWGGMIFSVIMFTVLHSFNNTYNSIGMYLFAASFRFIMNLLIFKAKFGIEFGIGVHLANNYNAVGWDNVFAGFFSIGGVILLVIYAILIFYIVSNFKEIMKVFSWNRLQKGWD